MELPQSPGRFRLSPPSAGFALGVILGVADWIILKNDWSHSRSGMWYLPPFVWVTVVWTSATICCLAGVMFSSPRLGRLRGVALGFAGPGMLLLIRGATPFRLMTALSTPWVLVTWLVVTLILSIPLAFLPMKRTRFLPAWLAGTTLSAALLIVLAADLDVKPLGIRRTGTLAADGQKNVALIFLDTVRYDDAMGGERPAMPILGTFARGATSFDNAWAPAPWTIPSHFAVLTGIDPWALPVEGASPAFHYHGPTLAERFRSRGYDTAAILANPTMGNPDFSAGFSRFTYSRASGVCRSAAGELLNRLWVHGGPRSPLCGWLIASEVTSRALQFVQTASRPYFLTLNYMDAHYPYYVPPECRDWSFRRMGRAEREEFRSFMTAPPDNPALLQHAHRQYQAAMRCMDRSLGTLIAALERDPRTIVVVLGDHGEQFGEHGLVEHGNSVYRQALHVPLIIRTPGEPAAHVAAPVSISDMYRSVLSAAGVLGSSSRLPIADERLRRPVIASYDAKIGTRVEAGLCATRGDYHYILWRDGREALFNSATDPSEAMPIPTASGPGAAIAGPLRDLAARAAASRLRLNEFHALGYIQ